jgi:hypothetical protein
MPESYGAAVKSWMAELQTLPAGRPPATFGEIWQATWAATGLSTLGGISAPHAQALAELEGAWRQQTGEDIETTLRRNNTFVPRTRDAQARAIAPFVAMLPEDQRAIVEPFLDVEARAATIAAEIEERAALVAANSYGLSGWAVATLASLSRTIVDPANLATMMIGGPLKGPLLRMLFREAGIGVATQAVQEPFIQGARAQLGLEAGVGQALSNIAMAGAGGAGLAALFRGAAAVLRLAQPGRTTAAPAAAPGAAAAGAPGAAGPTPPPGAAPGAAAGPPGAPPAPTPPPPTAPGAAPVITPGAAPGAPPTATPATPTAPAAPAPPRPAAVGAAAAPAPDPMAAAARAGITAPDLEAAANVVEREDTIIPPGSSPGARAATVQSVADAEEAIEAGRVPQMTTRDERVRADAIDQRQNQPQTMPAAGAQEVIIVGGIRVPVRLAIMELDDLIASHTADGRVNPNYPPEFQPRDRTSEASRSFILERSQPGTFEPLLLAGPSTSADTGPPVLFADSNVVAGGNGRKAILDTVYDVNPEGAAAYRQLLESQGWDVSGFQKPVLVRRLGAEVPDPVAFARQMNVGAPAKLSATEQAFADAELIDDAIMQHWRPGEIGSAANADFVRAFADKVIPAEHRPDFTRTDGSLSAQGEIRLEAALVARGWGDRELVKKATEAIDPTSKAILGAMADTAPIAVQLDLAIKRGGVEASADPRPAILEAFNLVDNARQSGQKVSLLVDQVDIERGLLPEPVKQAVRDFYRTPAPGRPEFTIAAGRDVVGQRLTAALNRAIRSEYAVGDMFDWVKDPAANLAASRHVGEEIEDIPPDPMLGQLVIREGETLPAEAGLAVRETIIDIEPSTIIDPRRPVPVREEAGDGMVWLERNRDWITGEDAMVEGPRALERELTDRIGRTIGVISIGTKNSSAAPDAKITSIAYRRNFRRPGETTGSTTDIIRRLTVPRRGLSMEEARPLVADAEAKLVEWFRTDGNRAPYDVEGGTPSAPPPAAIEGETAALPPPAERLAEEGLAAGRRPPTEQLEFNFAPPTEETFFTDLGPWPHDPSQPLGQQAQDYVRERGRETFVEHLVALDAEGNVVSHGSGGRDYVGLEPKLQAFLADPNQAIILHHNHPINTPLSLQDITQLGRPGLKAVWAHGSIDTVSRAELAPGVLEALGINAGDKLNNISVNIKSAFHRTLEDLVDFNRLDVNEANELLQDLRNIVTQRLGLIIYEVSPARTARTDRLVAQFGLEPAIARAMKAGERRIREFTDGRGFGEAGRPGRPAERLRAPGDMGAVFDVGPTGGQPGPIIEGTLAGRSGGDRGPQAEGAGPAGLRAEEEIEPRPRPAKAAGAPEAAAVELPDLPPIPPPKAAAEAAEGAEPEYPTKPIKFTHPEEQANAAEVERLLAENPDAMVFAMTETDDVVEIRLEEAIRRLGEDEAAIDELIACIGATTGGEP